jgi:hypothetical protein
LRVRRDGVGEFLLVGVELIGERGQVGRVAARDRVAKLLR